MDKDYFAILNSKNLGGINVRQDERGEPIFQLDDVRRVLNIEEDGRDVEFLRGIAPKLPSDPIVVVDDGIEGGEQKFISEAALYLLISQSNTPEAQDFLLWITGTVIRTLRKDDFYAMGEEDQSEDN